MMCRRIYLRNEFGCTWLHTWRTQSSGSRYLFLQALHLHHHCCFTVNYSSMHSASCSIALLNLASFGGSSKFVVLMRPMLGRAHNVVGWTYENLSGCTATSILAWRFSSLCFSHSHLWYLLVRAGSLPFLSFCVCAPMHACKHRMEWCLC